LSKYYLQLSSALQAQRYACSGGHIPLTEDTSEEKKDELEGDESDEELDQSEEEPEGKKKKKRKKTIVTYSEFVYTSKLKRLIEELSRIRDKEPDNKSLIFSNFSSTLIWLREELPKHGFQFRYITGQMPMRRRAEALRAFQNDPPTTGKVFDAVCFGNLSL
jgi:SNF2 family DNA or RNA helicase